MSVDQWHNLHKMSTGLTAYIAIGMVTGLILVYVLTHGMHFRQVRLYSGLVVVACGFLFAVPLLFELSNEWSLRASNRWWGAPLVLICYHLIYLNYILYIKKILHGESRSHAHR